MRSMDDINEGLLQVLSVFNRTNGLVQFCLELNSRHEQIEGYIVIDQQCEES